MGIPGHVEDLLRQRILQFREKNELTRDDWQYLTGFKHIVHLFPVGFGRTHAAIATKRTQQLRLIFAQYTSVMKHIDLGMASRYYTVFSTLHIHTFRLRNSPSKTTPSVVCSMSGAIPMAPLGLLKRRPRLPGTLWCCMKLSWKCCWATIRSETKETSKSHYNLFGTRLT